MERKIENTCHPEKDIKNNPHILISEINTKNLDLYGSIHSASHHIIYSENLTVLNVKQKNINTLDLSHCTNLRKLTCNGINLKKLILNKKLQLLFCARNKLTSLELTPNLLEVNC